MTKKEIREYCSRNNISQPKFSGKTKIMFVSPNLNYTHREMMKEVSHQIRYKCKEFKLK